MTIRPVYFVQSPSNTDVVDKISTGSDLSPSGSPVNPQSHVSDHDYHHDESLADLTSTPHEASRPLRSAYSSLRLHDNDRKFNDGGDNDDEDYDVTDGPDERRLRKTRFCCCLFFTLGLAFTFFCLVLWGVSRSFSPIVTVKEIVLESLNVQSGSDASGVLTDMLTLNSTVKILYRNPSNFFTVHVTSSPLQLSYLQLLIASGRMEKFSLKRKTERIIKTNILGNQISLYGGVPALYDQRAKPDQVVLPLNLTFTLRSRAYVLGRLVKTKFYTNMRCSITFRGDKLGKALDLSKSCFDHNE